MFIALRDLLIKKGYITLDEWNESLKAIFERYEEGWKEWKAENSLKYP